MNVVHVIGSGTIGEPLIGLLADNKLQLGIDEVSFHKRTPLIDERAKVESLIRRGAILVADKAAMPEFRKMGHHPSYDALEAIQRATVVVDCTPAGNKNKKTYLQASGPRGFIAQGSEHGFGKPYAYGINDAAILESDKFIQVVSCNTHNIAVLVKTIGFVDGRCILRHANFVCMRRANDISQDGSFIASPEVEEHDDAIFGTHHAEDAHALFATLGHDLSLQSSAIKLNTQYMHAIHFRMHLDVPLDEDLDREAVLARLDANPMIAQTHKKSANRIFSFGRDHGYYGRILNQTVVCPDTIITTQNDEVIGFCFTPQDANSIFSSLAAAMRFLHGDGYVGRLAALTPYLFKEI